MVPGSGRSPGEGNGNPLQYSCLRNPMDYNPLDRGDSRALVHEVARVRPNLVAKPLYTSSQESGLDGLGWNIAICMFRKHHR